MTKLLRIALAWANLVFLTAGCGKPTGGKVGEKKDQSVPSEERAARPARPSEAEPIGKTKSSVKQKTAADWIRQLKETDPARRIQAAEALGKMDFKDTGAITGPARRIPNGIQQSMPRCLCG